MVFREVLHSIELEFGSAGLFEEMGKPEYPGNLPLGAEKEPTTNLAHTWSELSIEPVLHRWEASALTTAPALLPPSSICSDEWLRLETSVFQIFQAGDSIFINSFHKTKLSCIARSGLGSNRAVNMLIWCKDYKTLRVLVIKVEPCSDT